MLPLEDFQDGLQVFLNRRERLGLVRANSLLKQWQIRTIVFEELLVGSGNGIAFFIEKLFDVPDQLQVLLPVDPLPSSVFGRGENPELRFPVAQDMGLDPAGLANLSDFVKKLLADDRHCKKN